MRPYITAGNQCVDLRFSHLPCPLLLLLLLMCVADVAQVARKLPPDWPSHGAIEVRDLQMR